MARHMLAFSTDYISMRLAGKGPGCGVTIFSLIGVTGTSKVQLHRRTARIFIDVIRLHCTCEQNYPDSYQVPWQAFIVHPCSSNMKTVISSVQLRYQPIINISN